MWGGFASRLGIDVTWGGELRWAATADGAAALAAQATALQAWGYPTRILDAAEVQRLEPDLHFDGFTAASYTYSDGHVDTAAVMRACLAAARERGAVLRAGSAVTGLEIDRRRAGAARAEAVRVGEEELPCDAVVLVGGADMPALAGNGRHPGAALPHLRGDAADAAAAAVVQDHRRPALAARTAASYQRAPVAQRRRHCAKRRAGQTHPRGRPRRHGSRGGAGSPRTRRP